MAVSSGKERDVKQEILPPLPGGSGAAEIRLSAKEAAFIEHYLRYRNATQAYGHAYDVKSEVYSTRVAGGQQVLARPHVQAALKARFQAATDHSSVDIGWLLQRFMDIATADPRELIGLKVGCCRFCHGDGHGYQWREREYLEQLTGVEREQARMARAGEEGDVQWPDIAGGFGFNHTLEPHPDCPQCRGEGVERFVPRDTDTLSDQALLLYGGVKVKKDGYEIVIADREKALEQVGRIMGAFTDGLRLSGSVTGLFAVADLAKLDAPAAAKAYQDFVRGSMAANPPNGRRLAKERAAKG
jgi:phage terminase small subunit